MSLILFSLFLVSIVCWIFGIYYKNGKIIKISQVTIWLIIVWVIALIIVIKFHIVSEDRSLQQDNIETSNIIELENQVKKINPGYIIELRYMKENRWLSDNLYASDLQAIIQRNMSISWTWDTIDSMDLYYVWSHYVENRKTITNLTKNTSYSWSAYYADNVDIRKELDRMLENKQMTSKQYLVYKTDGVFFENTNLQDQIYRVYGDGWMRRSEIWEEISKWTWTLIWK